MQQHFVHRLRAYYEITEEFSTNSSPEFEADFILLCLADAPFGMALKRLMTHAGD